VDSMDSMDSIEFAPRADWTGGRNAPGGASALGPEKTKRRQRASRTLYGQTLSGSS
jgi:hypothetical protein